MTYKTRKIRETEKGWAAEVEVETPAGPMVFKAKLEPAGRIKVSGERGVWVHRWLGTVHDARGVLIFKASVNGSLDPVGLVRAAGVDEYIERALEETGKEF